MHLIFQFEVMSRGRESLKNGKSIFHVWNIPRVKDVFFSSSFVGRVIVNTSYIDLNEFKLVFK